MFTKGKNHLLSLILMASICITGILFTGCPTGAPLFSTKLEIDGNLVADVIEAWKENWYRFRVDTDNTPLILIFKNLNLGDVEDAWLGYQINWYYKAKGGLQLLKSKEVPPTGPANPNSIFIIEDKAREFWVAPYKGDYYIRIYGYAQPVSENKKYRLQYAIGIRNAETYSSATELAENTQKEVYVLGDIWDIYKLKMNTDGVFRLKIEGTLNQDLVGTPEDEQLKSIIPSITKIDVYNQERPVDCTDNVNYCLLWIHPEDKSSYYLTLTGKNEFTNERVKLSLENTTVIFNPNKDEQTISIVGDTVRALKLNVIKGKTYELKVSNAPGVQVSTHMLTSNGIKNPLNLSDNKFTPNDEKAVYYLLLRGYKTTKAEKIKIKFSEL